MTCWLTLLFWIFATFLMAWAQGWLMPRLKETPDHTPQSNRQKFALHYILGVVWFLPVFDDWELLKVATWDWQEVVIALAVRFILFDAVLRYFENNPAIPVFAVGESANTDKLIRGFATFFKRPVTHVNAVLRIAAAGLLIWFMFVICGNSTGLSSTVF